mgnify:CR=1 FL=1
MYARKRALLILLISSLAFTQNNYPPNINADETVTFKKTIQTDLNLWIFYPDNHKKNDKVASIVFFLVEGGMVEPLHNFCNKQNIYNKEAWFQFLLTTE